MNWRLKFKQLLCKHRLKWDVWTDLVLIKRRCDRCQKEFVETYNGFKELNKHERK
jgi:hypothetical protein